jgi:hypothetical protein
MKIVGAAARKIIGLPSPRRMAMAREGMTVAKSGRSTGVTYGKVADDAFEFNRPSWEQASGAIRFPRVILIENPNRDFYP